MEAEATKESKNRPTTATCALPSVPSPPPDNQHHQTNRSTTTTSSSKNSNQPPSSPRPRHRIAMVCDFFWPGLGGVENHIWNLSQQLIRRGHKVIVLTHAYGKHRKGVRYLPAGGGVGGGAGVGDHRHAALKVYYCPIWDMPGTNATVPTFTGSLPLLRHIFLREGIDIVHGHQATSTLASEAIVYAGTMGLASVYTDHSLFGFAELAGVVLNRVIQTTLSTVDAAICVSHTCRDNFVLRAGMLGAEEPATAKASSSSSSSSNNTTEDVLLPLQERVRVIPNAVIPAQFTPLSPGEKQQKKKGNRIKVVVISRMVFRKGVDLLVGIIPAVCAANERVDFIIGGDGVRMLDLQEMVERERLEERVEFLFSVPHAQVRDVLVRGDVFLNCSLTESFCIAILEAASCGLLVVSTNVGGVPEVLPEDMVVLSDPNVPSMVESVMCAIQRQSETPMDPWKTHERVKKMYSWHRVAIETEQVYDRITQLKRKTFLERLAIYRRLGGMTGFVVCYCALIIEMVYQFSEWMFPRSTIDRAPDLC